MMWGAFGESVGRGYFWEDIFDKSQISMNRDKTVAYCTRF